MNAVEYETVQIEKTDKVCLLCEDYAKRQASKPIVVMCCEGGCLMGEVARRAANVLCSEFAREKTARLCLGGAFTKDTGQRALARNANRIVAIEGCFIECATRMVKGVVPGLRPEVVIADRLYDFDRNLFGIDEMPESRLNAHAREVAKAVAARL
ncbi:MAG: putative zinc-binding protein [Acidobacteriia bacterium]|nr:putative zinc-binding protein [Terriglobia bacterium]